MLHSCYSHIFTLFPNYKIMSKDIEVKTIKSAVSCTKITPPLKSPIGRVGGKSKLSKDIISLFPKHKHYVEVFGGGLSVLFAKQRSKLESVNDINSELINLFKIIRDKPESLSYVLEQMLISREVFEDIKTKKDAPSNDIKRAAYFYYLISQSF